ncbi:hypothetical protein BASA81_005639 [Batrachochytrium salamandrivorans]|nr:hypothetical protein BASA81_005639 [Batrachochytrium salamandrivorans]
MLDLLAARPSSTITFVDWDDSILPSTWLSALGGHGNMTPIEAMAVSQALFDLERSVIRLLHDLLLVGSVCLVTNAQTGWVELSCAKFLPNVLPLLAKTKIVSARTKYEHLDPNAPAQVRFACFSNLLLTNPPPMQWKLAAFRDELGLDDDCLGDVNIVSFGDSVYERDAMRCIAQELETCPTILVKTIKLMERPHISELHSQLEILISCMPDVVAHVGHLDLCLAPQQAPTPPTSPTLQQSEARLTADPFCLTTH